MLLKFQSLLRSVGFSGIIVLVDRLDEPHLINGSAELMKAVLWPLLDNKFLKHPGLGLKMMLPMELTRYIEREERPFYERARLDKQNLVLSFAWSGEALYDVANARLQACAIDGQAPALKDLFHPALNEQRLIETFRTLRVPRRLFKFLYRVIVAHCNAHKARSHRGGSRASCLTRCSPAISVTRKRLTAVWVPADLGRLRRPCDMR